MTKKGYQMLWRRQGEVVGLTLCDNDDSIVLRLSMINISIGSMNQMFLHFSTSGPIPTLIWPTCNSVVQPRNYISLPTCLFFVQISITTFSFFRTFLADDHYHLPTGSPDQSYHQFNYIYHIL